MTKAAVTPIEVLLGSTPADRTPGNVVIDNW